MIICDMCKTPMDTYSDFTTTLLTIDKPFHICHKNCINTFNEVTARHRKDSFIELGLVNIHDKID